MESPEKDSQRGSPCSAPGEIDGKSVAQRWNERGIGIHYDPQHSSSCSIPDNLSERYKVEPKMRPDQLKKLSPSDEVNRFAG
jgi:hypothetical protein